MVVSPALALLLGPPAPVILAAAVARCGARLDTVRPVNVHVHPAGGAVVRYTAQVAVDGGARTGEVLVAATGVRLPAGAAVVTGEHAGVPVEIGIWRFPRDPALPGLAVGAHPVTAAALLREHGLTSADTVGVAVRAYRPGSSAVLELCDGPRRWFVKVVRPGAAAGLRTRHELLRSRVPHDPRRSVGIGALQVAQVRRTGITIRVGRMGPASLHPMSRP